MKLLDRTRRVHAPVGFAVVDLETTGIYPTRDRIVEVAIVHKSIDGSVTETFCTLVDPRRDIGATRIHGLTATSVLGAPTFAEAAPAVWERLIGRVFVAHNARFDLSFLDAELARCGMNLPPPPVMCTMQLSSSYLAGLPARTLSACCDAAGIDLVDHHSALDDALAAAQLLDRYRSSHREIPPSWRGALQAAANTEWAPVARQATFQPLTRSDQVARRSIERAPLADLVHRLPRGSGGDTEHYLGVLDRVLEDRVVTSDEVTELADVALCYRRDFLTTMAA